jgi:glycine dehydrogenase
MDDNTEHDLGIGVGTFPSRHIGPSRTEVESMLDVIGAEHLTTLVSETVPSDIRQRETLQIGAGISERRLIEKMRSVASRNKPLTSLIGQGYYGTFLPPVIQRNILENPAWYTAYTPYQAEISQGRLEALLNFQTMVSDLTALPIANASLLDEATAAAESMAMARRISKASSKCFFVDRECHPQTIYVMRTRAEPLGWTLVIADPLRDLDPREVFGAIVQYPGTCGAIHDYSDLFAALRANDAASVMAADLLALAVLKPPGELGADIAVGSTQRFGMPLGYGGPHAAYIATRKSYERMLPGRIVGVSIDSRGRAAYRLALQTREQHIRREKATSNICTAQVLLAVIASMYAVYHGPDGLRQIASGIASTARVLAEGLRLLGWRLLNDAFFDTVLIEVTEHGEGILNRAVQNGINVRSVCKNSRACISVSCDETTGLEIVQAVWRSFGRCSTQSGQTNDDLRISQINAQLAGQDAVPSALRRTSDFMLHPVFHRHRTETELLRYMRRLADRDLALDRTMIPLGSCTMKLNATAEMMFLSWPEFSDIHPFAPADQADGYRQMIEELSAQLCAITGFEAISLQPNSGAQGEYAGLLAIRAYHRSRDEGHRTVCLIPTSAHGTNPASARMAGMDVVAVKCDPLGNIDVADLETKAKQYAENLAAVMITYPSTHGVFEAEIRRICDLAHACGAQVYLDGANLNAQVGLARPGDYGADIGHINLHKTFCIPHGGGGPGMGPVGAKAHLIPFLPGHAHLHEESIVGPVAAAPYGSASILTISWAYILLMGGEGLTAASMMAILNANYIAARLAGHYAILFRGSRGRVAHECIVDVRRFKETAGISVEDIAKRLIDYGLHAPTMSFPVAGTLMIEPTESESKSELDRFCNAMIEIRKEIQAIEAGLLPRDDNPLKNAPHTTHDLADEWRHVYSRKQACFPMSSLETDKYWPPVNRIDNAYGDRSLICSCPPVEALDAAAE